MNSEIKKKPIKPRKPRKPKTTKRKMTKDKSVKQNVNVNVTSSGGGGSGGASVPSAQPSYHPMMYQSSQAEKEANKGLLRSLEQLTKKQDDISALVRSLEKKPEDIQIKEEIKDKLNEEEEIQNDVEEEIQNDVEEEIDSQYIPNKEAQAMAEGFSKKIFDEDVENTKYKKELRKEIKKLGGGRPANKSTIKELEDIIYGLQEK